MGDARGTPSTGRPLGIAVVACRRNQHASTMTGSVQLLEQSCVRRVLRHDVDVQLRR